MHFLGIHFLKFFLGSSDNSEGFVIGSAVSVLRGFLVINCCGVNSEGFAGSGGGRERAARFIPCSAESKRQ